MFQATTDYGACPYDGLWLETNQQPRSEFLARLRLRRTGWPTWRYRGQADGIILLWDPADVRPYSRILVNPSRSGWIPADTVAMLTTVVPDPLNAMLIKLDSKVDLMGTASNVRSRLYMPYVRNHTQVGSTTYEGKRSGRGQLKVYDKGAQRGGLPNQVTRVEVSQRFQKGKQPTLSEFLAGALVSPDNRLYRVRDLSDDAWYRLRQFGMRHRAETVGLTQAIHELGHTDQQRARRIIGQYGGREIYDLFVIQAQAWQVHSI